MARSISVVFLLIGTLLLMFIAIESARAAAPSEVLRAEDSYDLRPDGAVVRVWRVAIRAAPGRHLARLPRDLRIETTGVSDRSHWRLDGARLTGPVCSGAQRLEAAGALAAIRREPATQVALADE